MLIAKPKAYRFNLTALLKLVHDYLSNRKQRKKINSSYSSLLELTFGVPQGLILGSLLFDIFLIDMFSIIEDTDNAIYADGSSIIIEVIRPVLNSFFFTIRFHKCKKVLKSTTKAPESTKKHQK